MLQFSGEVPLLSYNQSCLIRNTLWILWTFYCTSSCAKLLYILLEVLLSFSRNFSLHTNNIGIIFIWNLSALENKEPDKYFQNIYKKCNNCTNGRTRNNERKFLYTGFNSIIMSIFPFSFWIPSEILSTRFDRKFAV